MMHLLIDHVLYAPCEQECQRAIPTRNSGLLIVFSGMQILT